ncbi:MAG TPA: flagellin [Candidatus Krumholzibacteria bacterium]|nr:flagellin [Candidatus Krumholzibacteria bacterium]
MGLRVNTNLASINAQRNLMNTGVKLGKSLEKLSSGLRINRAGDDAAGLAISESLKSEIRALQQAGRNANDGISMVQTAEGSLDEISGIAIRLRELAEQAANGTLGQNERQFLDDEFQALTSEIDRIAATTEFNGTKLIDGSGGAVAIQVGTGSTADDRIDLDFATTVDATALSLDSATLTGADGANARDAIDSLDSALTTITQTRASFGAVQNRLESTVRNLGVVVENLSAANSRIRDVDVAEESANLTSLQILQQAGVSVLAQANLAPQSALSLLG